MLHSAEGMYYKTGNGDKILDGTAGLWCCNVGHGRRQIAEAVHKSLIHLDYAPSFLVSHPQAFQLSERLCALAPDGLNRVFYTNSGSESVDTALKIALAYHLVRGDEQRTLFIGREKSYHGVNFGGTSVGGIINNRKQFNNNLLRVDHIPHTLDIERNAFSRGLPKYGKEYADSLEKVISLHDASTIAAVIVEPIVGAGGVIPPPEGYLKRLREICDQYGILLIFDEVITGFGRVGKAFAAERFGVTPDIITTAKGLTGGTIPMGAVILKQEIYDAFMEGPEDQIEFFHGYTYSGHPVCCAAALATLDIYKDENLFQRTIDIAPIWEDAMHSLKDISRVIDIRNFGLLAGIELQSDTEVLGQSGYKVFRDCMEKGVLVRAAGDAILLSPPLIIEEYQIEQIVITLKGAIQALN
jgi:beta-alanine--pyruvate transaminase